ncbi:ATP-binding protein [Thalassobellus citreus]|uniref:ATP-binding protein n=1 Tax=Thalassobellus citreus TaxID=3367752 RepID=UPI0037884274
MKEVNLVSLVQAFKKFDEQLYQKYSEYFRISPKNIELSDLELLKEQIQLVDNEFNLLDKYFFGYTIPQIGKEFDLLRFGENYIVNIELKSINTGDRITKQLIRNKYYLSFLGVETYHYTFVSSEKKLYSIDENNDLVEKEFTELVQILGNQKIKDIINVDNLFNPSNYLISPFNSTKEFIEDKYFLTVQQEDVKRQVIDIISNNDKSFLSICGKAGTGKTLLTYDIAKKYIENNEKVLIIHCGKLNDGHRILNEQYKWDVISIRNLIVDNLSNYSLIILDETQRIYPRQLAYIINHIYSSKGSCIFSYDKQQCLRKGEMRNDIAQYISDNFPAHIFELTKKIRTNKEIASFIIALFNKGRAINKLDRSNIELNYFDNYKDAYKNINSLMEQGWKMVNYTPSSRHTHPYEKFSVGSEDNAHDVIGQEFDKVVAVIDSYFYYDGNELSTKGYKDKPYYHPTKMLFQIMTRTRKKLNVIIINNNEVMERCLSILE